MLKTIYILITFLLLSLSASAQVKSSSRAVRDVVAAQEGTPVYYEHQARRLFKQGKWEQGLNMVKKGMEIDESVSALNELLGQYWLHRNQHDKARYFLIRALRDNKDNNQARFLLMKVEEQTKHYSSAIVYCNELLEVLPYDYALWQKKISFYRRLGNKTEASRLLARLHEIYPERADLKKDLAWEQEEKYRKFRKEKNLAGQEETLRQLVKYTPKNAEFQMALCNLLLQTGRSQEAIDVAGYAATVVSHPTPFVEKKAAILGSLTRYTEAFYYLQSAKRNIRGLSVGAISRLETEMQREAARLAVHNDPYVAYARLYEKEHSDEALTYLLNTSTSRGYLDDALMYIREARKRRGDSEKLMYSEYTVLKRMGDSKAATNMLDRIHQKYPNNQDVAEELCLIRLEEVTQQMNFEHYDEAIPMLLQLKTFKLARDLKESINHKLFTCYVKTNQSQKALDMMQSISKNQQMTAELYEEVMTPCVKQLIAEGKLYYAEVEIQKVIDLGNPSAEMLRMGISVAMSLHKEDKARQYIQQGRERYPDNSYFMLKEAQLLADAGNYDAALDLLRPMLVTYVGDSAVISAYAGCCEAMAMKCIKQKDNERALLLIDDALNYYPQNQELIHAKANVYVAMKEWEKALEWYGRYQPSLAELDAYKLRTEDLKRHLLRNQVSIDYQMSRQASVDQITSTGLMAYTRYAQRNTYTFNLGYAGRDGLSQPQNAEDATGGAGVLLGADWEHTWNTKWTTNLIGAWSNKFFSNLRLEGKASYVLPKDWTAKGNLSYRRVGMDTKCSLFNLGLGTTKDIDRFSLGADVNLFAIAGKKTAYFNGSFFANVGAIAKFFPIEGSRTHLFLSGTVGNAPEISLVDNTMPVKFSQLNTMFSMGGQYVCSSRVDLGLTGSWYTMTINPTSSTTTVSRNKNYLYLNANVTIHF